MFHEFHRKEISSKKRADKLSYRVMIKIAPKLIKIAPELIKKWYKFRV